MIVIALLLIALAVVVAVGMLQDATEAATVEVWGLTWATTSLGLFLLGAAMMLALALGVWLLLGSLKRARSRRTKRREAERNRRDEVQRLAAEKAELEQRLQSGHRREDESTPGSRTTGVAGESSGSAPYRGDGRPDRHASTARDTDHIDITHGEQRQRH